jgi:hypothetical protein
MGYDGLMQATQVKAVVKKAVQKEELGSQLSGHWAADRPVAHAVLSPLCLKRNKV